MTRHETQTVASNCFNVHDFHATWCACNGVVEGAMCVSADQCSALLMHCEWCRRTSLGNIPDWGRDLFSTSNLD